MPNTKRYDRAYFDRFYRKDRTRVHAPADVERKVHLAVSAAEFMLGREIRTVLDVGAGEGAWQPILARMRRGIRYLGVDPSEYAVARYGASRNLRLGSFDGLDAARVGKGFDLIVCADVMNYLSPGALRRGLGQIAGRLRGLAYLEIYTDRDELTGDLAAIDLRPPEYYERALRRAGLIRCGMHCYVGERLAPRVVAMEGGW
ncbi:MAG: class I SAM-dependent methyltransferase [Gemmatimonadaceae bacterium]|nr:class I SAM-dependent methyltransferase [Gemmatimonadaceae bacterium]NUQ92065.1 class I SAM-dependent methyltransferase [Gemmatimonadaceae bacterium]NUR20084.1 class I SAM-dependent methyltransferase [Gemmatimonadaceae bacterium]NUS96518.1 class I SAM-dependent methyltransferase [Gemmatimonadaceae bacterium]